MALNLANIRATLKRTVLLNLLRSRSRNICSPSPAGSPVISPDLEFSPECDETTRKRFEIDMQIHKDFISPEEEIKLMEELDLKFRRSRYQYDHWDDAIHGYRETEKPTWNEANSLVIARVRNFSFPNASKVMQHVHVLDLAENGHIKPHLDSIKFCGNTISGISLLSDSVMRFVHTERPEVFATALLPRRSLYIMRNYVRYEYNHEILDNSVSFFRGERITKTRRISVICRNSPTD